MLVRRKGDIHLPDRASSPATGPGTVGSEAKVFVIDDDPSIRRSLSRLLRSAGFAVEEFSSAGEFLERCIPPCTGCVVLDVRMPQMSGPELFDRMVASGSSLPVVFLTGHGTVPTSVSAMKKGAADFLLKPVDDETLLWAIRKAVERHAAARALAEMTRVVHARFAGLTPRERQVMQLVVRGQANKVIAADLGITEKTVKVHRHNVMEKTRARSVAELVRLADADAASAPPDERAASPDRRND